MWEKGSNTQTWYGLFQTKDSGGCRAVRGSGHSGEFRCVNPCGQSGKGGGQDQFKPSARAPARHDSEPRWQKTRLESKGGREAGHPFWVVAWEEALVNQLNTLQILGETSRLEIKICESASSS